VLWRHDPRTLEKKNEKIKNLNGEKFETSSHNTVIVNKRMTDCSIYHATKTRQICCGETSSEETALKPSGKCVANAAVRLIALVQDSAADSPK